MEVDQAGICFGYTPIAANQFRVACNEHDACYDTYGKSKLDCDNAFHNRMLGICARDHNTIVGRPLKIACNGRADAYYVGVRDHAQDAYNKAQAAAARSSFVKLRNKNWNRCLNLQSATQNGVTTNAWECVSHPDQEWKIEDAGNGFVKLRNKNWNKPRSG